MPAFNLPINSTSFGSISIGLLRYCFENKIEFDHLLPIGQINADNNELTKDFVIWLQNKINGSLTNHKRSIPVFKLWHLNGSLESFSNDQTLLTFYELDSPTDVEMNIISNQKKVLVTSSYTKNVLNLNGAENVEKIPLFFDKYNFVKIPSKILPFNRITFNVVGKFEKRKQHERIIKLWIKKFGNNPNFALNCAIYNPFLSPEDNQKIWMHLVEGKKYFNVNFLGFMPKNNLYNDFLNSGDVVIGCGTEGWGLPEFHSVALGKHAVLLDCCGYKEWANENNSVLIKPNGKEPVYDGMFFHPNQPYNQGNIFTFSEKDFYEAIDKVILKVKTNKENIEGYDLQNKFSVDKTLNEIFKYL